MPRLRAIRRAIRYGAEGAKTRVNASVADDSSKETPMNPSAMPTPSRTVPARHVDRTSVDANFEAVEHLIARVLRRGHQRANAHNDPNAARAILQVAHLFADELASTNDRFDRLWFIRAATRDQL